MSKKNTKSGSAPQEQGEKKMTRYDLKMKYRKEQEEKAKKRAAATKGICAVVVVAVIAGCGYKAYQSYESKYGPYLTIGDHKIMKTEFDYYYNTAFNTFYNSYGSYASYFGLDVSEPLDEQYYTDDLTWKDYFEQQAVTQMSSVYALYDEGKANGFEYDATEDVNDFVTSIEESASSNDESTDEFIVSAYGDDATLDDIKSYVETSSYANAYYEDVESNTEITDDEISEYYDENKDDYDLVDYLVCKIEADVPDTDDTDSDDELSDEEEEALEAAKEEATENAMAEAEKQADKMLSKITDEASFESLYEKYTTDDSSSSCVKEGVSDSSISPTDLETWLFDSSRQAGDTTVIEDADNNCYYVAYFQNRYRNDEKTVDVRHILIQAEDVDTDDMTDDEKTAAEEEADAAAKEKAEEIYDEWKSGDATEDSFAELANEYSEDTGSNTNGGLYTQVTDGQMVSAFNDWIFDSSRQPGDCEVIESSYGYHIIYYVSDDEPEYYVDIKETLLSDKMDAFMEDLTEDYQPVEKNGTLDYLHVSETETETETETASETETAAETETETASK